MEPFPVLRVNLSDNVANEQLGSKPKFWFRDGDREMLFKAEDRGAGEDWAEVISCQLCKLLGLPHVTYQMAALFDGEKYLKPGVVCQNMTPDTDSLIMGNEMLWELDPGYPKKKRYKVQQHSVQKVCQILNFLQPPETSPADPPAGIETQVDYFIGYVLLDTWIANTDRHHENWAAISSRGKFQLAPTFDHGASLGNILQDAERADRLKTKDEGRSLAAYARRGRSAFYGRGKGDKPMKTIDAFKSFANYSKTAAPVCLERLQSISPDTVLGLLNRVPDGRMTEVCRDFTHQLLCINRQRLLDLDLKL